MEEQLHMSAAAAMNRATPTTPDKKSLRAVASPGMKVGSAVAPVVMVTSPRSSSSSSHHAKQQGSPRACLCSPTTHAGSFRCRLHRGCGFASGLPEMGGKKPDE